MGAGESHFLLQVGHVGDYRLQRIVVDHFQQRHDLDACGKGEEGVTCQVSMYSSISALISSPIKADFVTTHVQSRVEKLFAL